MPVLCAFRFTAEATAGAGTRAALAAAKPPSRAENAQTRRSAEVGERERRPSGEPKRKQATKEPPRLAQSHGRAHYNLVFLVTHIIPSTNYAQSKGDILPNAARRAGFVRGFDL